MQSINTSSMQIRISLKTMKQTQANINNTLNLFYRQHTFHRSSQNLTKFTPIFPDKTHQLTFQKTWRTNFLNVNK